jgi:hypothetical protein
MKSFKKIQWILHCTLGTVLILGGLAPAQENASIPQADKLSSESSQSPQGDEGKGLEGEERARKQIRDRLKDRLGNLTEEEKVQLRERLREMRGGREGRPEDFLIEGPGRKGRHNGARRGRGAAQEALEAGRREQIQQMRRQMLQQQLRQQNQQNQLEEIDE